MLRRGDVPLTLLRESGPVCGLSGAVAPGPRSWARRDALSPQSISPPPDREPALWR